MLWHLATKWPRFNVGVTSWRSPDITKPRLSVSHLNPPRLHFVGTTSMSNLRIV